jgi:hypothetical protein
MPKRKSRSPIKRKSRSYRRKKSRSPTKRKSRLVFGAVSSVRKNIKTPDYSDITSKRRLATYESKLSKSRELRSSLISKTRFKIAQFRIFDENLKSFKRLIDKPMDCVVNAMQIIGVINSTTADLLRIKAGKQVFQIDEIEKMFTLYFPHIFKFKSMDGVEWVNQIKQILKPGHVMFVGYSDKNGPGHVFLVGRLATDSKDIIMLDPQLPPGYQYCPLKDDRCFDFISNKTNYYILNSSLGKTSEAERLKILKN